VRSFPEFLENWSPTLTKRFLSGSFFKLIHCPYLTLRTKKEQCSYYVLKETERGMLKTFVEEAAALASIVLFVGMIAVWAQLIPQL
jgi:hypothetical protein